jgi:hypothetical protein
MIFLQHIVSVFMSQNVIAYHIGNNLGDMFNPINEEGSLSINNLTYRLIKSSELLVKSTIPPVGRVTRPINPFPKPLKKPDAPSCFAPATGFVTTPFKPSTKPYLIKKTQISNSNSKDFQPTIITFFPPVAISVATFAPGSLRRIREALYSSSNVNVAKPFPSTPVIFEKAPAAPPTAEPNNDLTPVATPSANSIGPSIAPFKQNTNILIIFLSFILLYMVHKKMIEHLPQHRESHQMDFQVHQDRGPKREFAS